MEWNNIIGVNYAQIPDTTAIHFLGESATYESGDPTGDNTIDVSDAVWTLTLYAKQAAGQDLSSYTQAEKNAADVNHDGTIDVNDAVLILTYYAKQAAGQNPSWDNLG